MKQLPVAVLKGYPFVGASLCSLHVPSAFGGTARFDMNRSHIFPQCVLAAITLVGGGAGDGGSRDRAKCEAGIPLCSVAITTLLGAGVNPKLIQVLQEADPKMRLTARILLGEMPV